MRHCWYRRWERDNKGMEVYIQNSRNVLEVLQSYGSMLVKWTVRKYFHYRADNTYSHSISFIRFRGRSIILISCKLSFRIWRKSELGSNDISQKNIINERNEFGHDLLLLKYNITVPGRYTYIKDNGDTEIFGLADASEKDYDRWSYLGRVGKNGLRTDWLIKRATSKSEKNDLVTGVAGKSYRVISYHPPLPGKNKLGLSYDPLAVIYKGRVLRNI